MRDMDGGWRETTTLRAHFHGGPELWQELLGEGGSIRFQDSIVVDMQTSHPHILVARVVDAYGFPSCCVLLPFRPDRIPIPTTEQWLRQMDESGRLVCKRWMTLEEVGVMLVLGEPVLAINHQGWRCG